MLQINMHIYIDDDCLFYPMGQKYNCPPRIIPEGNCPFCSPSPTSLYGFNKSLVVHDEICKCIKNEWILSTNVFKTIKIHDFAITDDERHAHRRLFKHVRSGTVPCLTVRARTGNRSLVIFF